MGSENESAISRVETKISFFVKKNQFKPTLKSYVNKTILLEKMFIEELIQNAFV